MKSDFGGHSNIHYNNIVAYVNGQCFGICQQLSQYNDGYYNNTCIINKNSVTNYGGFSCGSSQTAWPILSNNTVYVLGSNVNKVGLCGLNEKDFQTKYKTDIATIIKGYPDNKAIIQQAKQLLMG